MHEFSWEPWGPLFNDLKFCSIFEKSYAGLGAILSGKELSRGTRPHTLLYRKLMGLIIWRVFILNREIIFQSECLNLPSKVKELKDMVSQYMSKDISENKLENSRPFLDARQKVKLFKESLSASKTLPFWLQYMYGIEISLPILKAERYSNWMLHIKTNCEMIPFFCYTRTSHICKVIIHVLTCNVKGSNNSPRCPANVPKRDSYNVEKVINFRLDCPVTLWSVKVSGGLASWRWLIIWNVLFGWCQHQ